MTTNIMYRNNNTITSIDSNYQGFEYNVDENICIPKNHRVIPKWKAVSGIFSDIVEGRTFMDLGANMGFFCFKALECRAEKVYGIESNKLYYDSVSNVIKGINNIQWLHGRFPIVTKESNIKADVVMSLSLIHHLFAKYSLEEIIKDLYDTTNQYVIAEWISENDAQVKLHNYSNKEEYNSIFFKEKVMKYFSKMEFIEEGHHPTRLIYLLSK